MKKTFELVREEFAGAVLKAAWRVAAAGKICKADATHEIETMLFLDYKKYDPAKMDLPGWIAQRMGYYVARLTHQAAGRLIFCDGAEEPCIAGLAAKTPWVANLKETLTDDANTILDTILQAPAEILQTWRETALRRDARAMLARHAQKSTGWTRRRVMAAWERVGECLASV